MPHYSGSRPRYPLKKKRLRRITLLALGAALLLCAIAVPALLTDSSDNSKSTPEKPAQSQDFLPELRVEEAYPQGPLPAGLLFDRLFLEKSLHRLTAYTGGKVMRVYLVALGENPLGAKQHEGDKRTPEGFYRITDKDPGSAYHKSLGLSYPNERDREHATALKKNPGGNIKIHGLAGEFAHVGAAHRLTDWTYGSIALTNPEMDELFARTSIGTPVEITP
ncbi:MAG: L,D-transpeptidase family protein [Desulfovibrio sp.]|jgi:murein L,D-transpeptidase YafK|nr:L,D-transpeptidase family protein [Desulfovibrio sp.]